MDNQQKAPPVREFSTRFLPNNGIPEYNALLDNHLGKRREFLLGNRHSLELMQQTGVIERVETQPDNPNQYVVHIADKPIHRRKRLPPRSASGPLQPPESQTMPWRQYSANRELRRGNTSTSRLNTDGLLGKYDDVSAAKKANAATLKGLSRSFSSNTVLSTSCKPVLKSAAANRLALFGSTKCSALLEASGKHRASSDVSLSQVTEKRTRSRSAVSTKVSKRSVASTASTSHTSNVKGTVEHLLESDAAFMTQIRTMKEQLTELEGKKSYLDTEIGNLRRKLRGVNAVRENDVAVAHCSSIMQHRLSKAEEEFMKLVTQQQEVKKDVDRVRRELLSMRKVRQKLQEDIEDVAQANQSYEEKIHTSKIVRNQLSEELSELERSAEAEIEAQRLNLPPEEAVVVDVNKLMGAVKERRHALNSMGFPDLEALEEQFTTTEEQLLSKYKANLALADEVAALEKEISAINNEKKINRANVRGIAQASEKIERDMQIRTQSVLKSINSYNDLREQRNREHAKLRDIMLRCLDALQIDVRGSDLPDDNGNRSSNGRSKTHWAEAPSPELLEMLQRKMTQVAVTLKVKHSSRILEIPPEALRMNRGHDGRRSNMFSTREASKIVLGPREPSGSALSAILGTVQPPSIENAVALTENVSMMEVMHGLHRSISPARRKASLLSIVPPGLGKPVNTSTTGNATPTVVNLLNAGNVRRSAPNTLPPVRGRSSLAAMIEADKEEDEDDEENDGENENDQAEVGGGDDTGEDDNDTDI
ncbi:Mitochondrial Protein Translocase (MPT) Family [Phytophthora nicotianae]|uniref:Mitochondrial Protein Translocase (MPT) Family n=1 Tax=Phytophthora nicotianae TaxID=4792 RepID=A0A0W8DCR9_PHYNI|nr:Mitochondrial Protein Translocase (MPT) Family [Phytophthora nicotianae]